MEDSRLHVISNFRILSLQISRRQIGLTVEPAFASALFGLLLASRVRGAGVPTAWITFCCRCNTAYYTRCSTIQVLRNVPLACGGDICYRPVFPRKIRTWIAALFVSVDLLGAIRSSRTRRSAAFVASFRWYPHAMEKFCRLLHFSNSPIITKMIHGTYLREGNWSFQVHGDISVVACVGFCSSSASFLRYR